MIISLRLGLKLSYYRDDHDGGDDRDLMPHHDPSEGWGIRGWESPPLPPNPFS